MYEEKGVEGPLTIDRMFEAGYPVEEPEVEMGLVEDIKGKSRNGMVTGSC